MVMGLIMHHPRMHTKSVSVVDEVVLGSLFDAAIKTRHMQ